MLLLLLMGLWLEPINLAGSTTSGTTGWTHTLAHTYISSRSTSSHPDHAHAHAHTGTGTRTRTRKSRRRWHIHTHVHVHVHGVDVHRGVRVLRVEGHVHVHVHALRWTGS